MVDVSMLTNYAHSDWLIGEGRGLCQRFIHVNFKERVRYYVAIFKYCIGFNGNSNGAYWTLLVLVSKRKCTICSGDQLVIRCFPHLRVSGQFYYTSACRVQCLYSLCNLT